MANPEVVRSRQATTSGRYRVAGGELTSDQAPMIELIADGSTESTTYFRYRQLVDRVTDAFGDATVASRWLSTPSSDFNSQPPIEVAKRNGYDVAILEPILIRIEHGVDF